MKKTVVMIMAGIMLVAMAACGKDAGANQPQSDLTADEELEMLNAEIAAMIEAEQREAEREAEERAQRLEEGYPEGVLPEGQYICREIYDGYDGDIFVPVSFEVPGSTRRRFDYIYDFETKQYTAFHFPDDGRSKWDDREHHLEGYLDEDGNFVVTYYVRYDRDKLYEIVGTITGENQYDRFEEEHPEVAEVILDDIEWVYVFHEE